MPELKRRTLYLKTFIICLVKNSGKQKYTGNEVLKVLEMVKENFYSIDVHPRGYLSLPKAPPTADSGTIS
jgi:hypothetical protein